MSSSKRKPSHFPEGSSGQRKTSRTVPNFGPNGNVHQATIGSLINPSADPRKQRASVGGRSPGSTDGSTYQDANSSRSTPQPQFTGRQTAVMTATKPSKNETALQGNPMMAAGKVIIDHMATRCSLQVAQRLVVGQLEKAHAEYDSMRKDFPKFPAVQERVSSNRDKLQGEMSIYDRQLESLEGEHARIASMLSKAVSEVLENIDTRPQDVVSRNDYDALDQRHQRLEKRHQALQDSYKSQQSAIEELQRSVKSMIANAAAAKNTESQRHQVTSKRFDALERMQQTETSSTQKVDQMEHRVYSRLDTLSGDAEKEKVKNKAANDGLKSELSDLKSSLAKNKADTIAKLASLSQYGPKLDSLTTTVSKQGSDLQSLNGQVDTCKNELDKVWSEIADSGKGSVVERLKRQDQSIMNLWTRVEATAKDPAVEKVSKLQELVKCLEDEFQKIKDEPKSDVRPLVSEQVPQYVTEDCLNQRISTLENQIEEDSTERDASIASYVDGRYESVDSAKEKFELLSKKLEGFSAEHRKAMDASVMTNADFQSETKKIVESHHTTLVSLDLQLKGGLEKVERAQAQLKGVSDKVDALEQRLAPRQSSAPPSANPHAVQSPRMPAPQQIPSPLPQGPARHPSFFAHSPIDQTQRPGNFPVPGNPNAVRSPITQNTPFNQPNGVHAGSSPSHQDFTHLQNQITGVSGHVQQLRQRFDNLTTEEVVRSMVDQMSKMYPAAKNFELAAKELQVAMSKLLGNHSHMRQALDSIFVKQDGNNKAVAERMRRLEDMLEELKSSRSGASGGALPFDKLEQDIRLLTTKQKQVQDSLDGPIKATFAQLQGGLRDVQTKQDEVNNFINSHVQKIEAASREMKTASDRDRSELERTLTSQLEAHVQKARTEVEGAMASQVDSITGLTGQVAALEAYVLSHGRPEQASPASPGSD